MLEGIGGIVHNAIESVMGSEQYQRISTSAQIMLSPIPQTAPLLGEKRSLELAITSLLEFNLHFSADAVLKLAVLDQGESIRLRITAPKSSIDPETQQLVTAIMLAHDLTKLELDGTWVTLVIAKEYVGMHGGHVSFEQEGDAHHFYVDMPTYDPFANGF